MPIRCHAVLVTTDSSQAATEYTETINGELLEVQYVKTDFANGSTITITGATTGRSIWSETGVNASTVRSPRQACHSILGAALVYAGTDPVTDRIRLAEKIKVVIANGGATKSGKFHFITKE